MSCISVFRAIEKLPHTVVEDVAVTECGELVIAVRPQARQASRCGRCRRPSPRYDAGRRRRWRTLDHATTMTYLEASAPRVRCRTHGVVVCHVPWAAHGAGHTHAFDQQVAWLAVRNSKSTVSELMRVGWRTVGAILDRVHTQLQAVELAAGRDGLNGLRRIGIDEISYRRGQKFLTVVVDHDTKRLVWAQPGRDSLTLRRFFDALGAERSAQITHVSSDQATWIHAVLRERCPQAIACADAFHLVKWANQAVGIVRAAAWRAARAGGATRKNGIEQGRQRRDSTGAARELGHAKYSLVKNPENLTPKQQLRLDWIAATHPMLWEAYRLKEGLRLLLKIPGINGVAALTEWIKTASTSPIPEFVHLARRIDVIRDRIENTLLHGLSNALVESTNTKIRLLTRIAYGFHGPAPLIAIAMLSLGHHRPTLPGRDPHT